MRELSVLLAHLLTTLVKLCRPGGLYTVAAESLAVKHQPHEPVSPSAAKIDTVG